MSNYNQPDQGKPDQHQQGNELGEGQDPAPKPGAQTDLPDQTNKKIEIPDDPESVDKNPPDKVRLYDFPGGESG
jgi:hypothetical protein